MEVGLHCLLFFYTYEHLKWWSHPNIDYVYDHFDQSSCFRESSYDFKKSYVLIALFCIYFSFWHITITPNVRKKKFFKFFLEMSNFQTQLGPWWSEEELTFEQFCTPSTLPPWCNETLGEKILNVVTVIKVLINQRSLQSKTCLIKIENDELWTVDLHLFVSEFHALSGEPSFDLCMSTLCELLSSLPSLR